MSRVGASINKENVVHVSHLGGLGGPTINNKDNFWNVVFDKELPKYQDHLDVIFLWTQLRKWMPNTISRHVFNNL